MTAPLTPDQLAEMERVADVTIELQGNVDKFPPLTIESFDAIGKLIDNAHSDPSAANVKRLCEEVRRLRELLESNQ